jgi:putative hydrolase of the HAD superfamily
MSTRAPSPRSSASLRELRPPVIRAVTFDYWDTLVSDDGSWRAAHVDDWMRILAGAGVEVPLDVLEAAFAENWAMFDDHWKANDRQWTPTDATDFICDYLGVEAASLRDELIDSYRVLGESGPLLMAEGVVDTLTALRAEGVRLGIVCDVGLTEGAVLRQRLEGMGLLSFFDAWAFSDETGWFKPAAQAFLPALEGLDIDDASQAAHIGDRKETDVAGALALGMTAIRFAGFQDRVDDEGPEASIVLSELVDLPGSLGF